MVAKRHVQWHHYPHNFCTIKYSHNCAVHNLDRENQSVVNKPGFVHGSNRLNTATLIVKVVWINFKIQNMYI